MKQRLPRLFLFLLVTSFVWIHPPCLAAGKCYRNPNALKKNEKRNVLTKMQFKMMHEKCKKGSSYGCSVAGKSALYTSKFGDEKRRRLAAAYFKKGCKQMDCKSKDDSACMSELSSSVESCHQLATFYIRKRKMKLAEEAFKKDCEMSNKSQELTFGKKKDASTCVRLNMFNACSKGEKSSCQCLEII